MGGILRVSGANWKVCGTNISGQWTWVRYYGSQAQTGKFAVQTSAVSKSQGSRVELAPTSTSPYIFIEKTTETRDVCVSQRLPFGCMLFNNFNIYV